MSVFWNHYLREVLGIQRYILPAHIWNQRTLKGKWPCRVLAVTFKSLNEEETSLLNKIMKSISISQFSILQCKQDNDSLLEELKQVLETNLVELVILFGKKTHFKNENFLNTYSLDKLTGSSPDIQQRKKELWLSLQQIKKEISK